MITEKYNYNNGELIIPSSLLDRTKSIFDLYENTLTKLNVRLVKEDLKKNYIWKDGRENID